MGIYRLSQLEKRGIAKVSHLPFSIRILLEAVLRNCDGYQVSEDDVKNLANWNAAKPAEVEVPFKPARVVLQDFTGVPAVVDLAAMRDGMKAWGEIQKDQSIDSCRLGHRPLGSSGLFRHGDSPSKNVEVEFERNKERYEFLQMGPTSV
jgi:aconitate hydratase